MLVWIEKPNEKECRKVGVGSKKFYCGREKKYGLNLQSSCDHLKQFTSVSIIYPASTSDFLAFETSRFHTEIKQEGFLAEGLCLPSQMFLHQTAGMSTTFIILKSESI